MVFLSRLSARIILFALALAIAPPLAAADPAAVERYLPGDTDMVASANVGQILDSPLFKKYALEKVQAWLKTDPRAQVMRLVGLEPLRDIDRLTVAGPGSFAIRKRWIAVVDGRFDLPKIQTAAVLASKIHAERLKIDYQEDVPVYEVHGKDHPEPVFAAFLDKTTLVVSPVRGWVRDAVLKSLGKKTGKLDDDVHKVLSEQDTAKSLWLAGIPIDLVRNQLAGNPRLQSMFTNVRSFSGVLTIDDAAHVDIRVQTKNDRSGLQLRRFFEGARAIVILAITSNEKLQEDAPLLTGLVKTFEFFQEKGAVVVAATIADADIDKWIKKEQRRRERGQEAPPPR